MQKKLRTSAKIIIMSVVVGIVGTMTTIILLASSSRSIKIQNFIGLTKKQVQTWVNDNDVDESHISYTYEYDEERDKDIVIDQSLTAGEVLSEDSVLSITLSNGADPEKEFALIDFNGKHEEDIKAWFEENKFSNVSYVYEYHVDQEDKLFVSCEPSIGTTVKRGDAIKVVISVTEPQSVTVPDLSSYSKENIDAWANENQITIDYQEEYSDTIESGKVISVSVETGSTIKQTETITIKISKGKEGEDESTNETSTSNASTASSSRSYSSSSSSSYSGSVNGNTVSEQTNVTNDEAVSDNSSNSASQVTCGSLTTFLYNGKSGSEIASSVSSSTGCSVNINYLSDSSSNPDSISGGIASYSVSGSTYYINVYQSWK